MMRKQLMSALLTLATFSTMASQSESEDAVTRILFDANMENVSYSLRGDGFVDITFGAAVSEAEYIRIIERLRAHPDIPGVLAGRGAKNYCSVP